MAMPSAVSITTPTCIYKDLTSCAALKINNHLQSPKEWVTYCLIVNKHSPESQKRNGKCIVHSTGMSSSFRVEKALHPVSSCEKHAWLAHGHSPFHTGFDHVTRHELQALL